MSESVSAVIPVKDGARYLSELLDALAREGVDEILVIDSGSHDGSPDLAREKGAVVIEIAPSDFGHGRTRNLGAERARGDVIAFLTQDATPAPGWLAAVRDAFTLSHDVGAVFGPHLPRDGTSPMIARELIEFFATFGEQPRIFDEPTFLSNVNAAYRRACWSEIRFEDVAYSEDQAFGRALAAHPRWQKAYHPGAAVLHAHDYPPFEFMRRYFDEYRGLRETIGHVERIGVRSTVRDVRRLVAADRRYMAETGIPDRARWTARSAVHHGGRKAFSALGSRANRLHPRVQRTLSLEGRSAYGRAAAPQAPPLPPLEHREATPDFRAYEGVARVLKNGPAPVLEPYLGAAERERLHIAFAVPTFNIGSGGHNIIFQIMLRLERMGHVCSIWIHDLFGHRPNDGPALLQREIRESFAPVKAPVFREFERWYGADVVVATAWQTVYPVLELDGVRARAYLVNDHEPEFFATSVESEFARRTYSLGLYGIAGSPWLRDLYVDRYGGQAGTFQYGVDHDVYFPRPIERRRDTVVAYARAVTPRRAVGLVVPALEELRRRRPDVRIVLFGDKRPTYTPFAFEHAGVASHEALSWLFSEATVGLCLSLTNYSLIPQEMLACGLPCVDLDRPSTRSVFGPEGPVRLADPDPDAIADALEALLDDEREWARRSQQGLEFVREHTWDAAAEQVESELRNAMRVLELAIT